MGTPSALEVIILIDYIDMVPRNVGGNLIGYPDPIAINTVRKSSPEGPSIPEGGGNFEYTMNRQSTWTPQQATD